MSKRVGEGSSRSLRGGGNKRQDREHDSSNLNSDYLGTEYKYL